MITVDRFSVLHLQMYMRTREGCTVGVSVLLPLQVLANTSNSDTFVTTIVAECYYHTLASSWMTYEVSLPLAAC